MAEKCPTCGRPFRNSEAGDPLYDRKRERRPVRTLALVVERLTVGAATLTQLEDYFLDHGFAASSVGPCLTFLFKDGVVERVGSGAVYKLKEPIT